MNAELFQLERRLEAYRLETRLTDDGALIVRNDGRPGCCDLVAHLSDRIRVRSRLDDDGRAWFFTSWGEPIAEAERIIDASVLIAGYLKVAS